MYVQWNQKDKSWKILIVNGGVITTTKSTHVFWEKVGKTVKYLIYDECHTFSKVDKNKIVGWSKVISPDISITLSGSPVQTNVGQLLQIFCLSIPILRKFIKPEDFKKIKYSNLTANPELLEKLHQVWHSL